MRNSSRNILLLALLVTIGGLLTACVDKTAYQGHDSMAGKEGQIPPYMREKNNTELGRMNGGRNNTAERLRKKPASQPDGNAMIDMANIREVKVALLVPMTGEAAEIGNALADAAMLALFDKYSNLMRTRIRTKVILLPKDTESSVRGAERAAKEAISEGAQLIIGPLFSKAVEVVAPIARKHDVNMITFSNNRDMAQEGVFLFGLMPEQQVERIVKEAYSRGVNKIALLAPNNHYGQVVATAMRKYAILYNKPPVIVELYPPNAVDVDIEIQKILSSPDGTERLEPLGAIMIAEGGRKLEYIAERLKLFGMGDNVKLLGTELWDDKSILDNENLRGGWFASLPRRPYKGFERRFMGHYGYVPARLSSLAYDAVALAASLANYPDGPDFSIEAITLPSGYYGSANGVFRCHRNGICERKLAIIEVGDGVFREIKSAPRAFHDVKD